MQDTKKLRVKIFADGADKAGILKLYENPLIQGFTTNPTLMRKAGITDYEAFSRDLLESVPDRPISLEVFADVKRAGNQHDFCQGQRIEQGKTMAGQINVVLPQNL